MRIIVPSLGRAGTANSMKWLPEAGHPISLAVHEDEVGPYQNAYPNTAIFVLSEACRHHVGLVRKEIMERIREPFFFVDDDIRISLVGLASIPVAFDLLETHLKSGASMAGLGQQLFSNTQKTIIVNGDPFVIRNRFVATVYAINPSDFDTCPLEQLPVYEDLALCIHAIQHGGGVITTFAATHSNISPALGGCNQWREKEVTLASLNKVVELYPGICSIRETFNTTHNQYLGVGVRTEWSKIRKLA